MELDSRLEKLYYAGVEIVESMGYFLPEIDSVKVNSRLRQALGRAIYRCTIYGTPLMCKVEISSQILGKNVNKNFQLSVMVHELLHTIWPKDNHQGRWLEAAYKINQRYPNLNITRLANLEGTGVESNQKNEIDYKYVVICNSCGAEFKYKRLCKVVETGGKNCICPKCRGDKFTVSPYIQK